MANRSNSLPKPPQARAAERGGDFRPDRQDSPECSCIPPVFATTVAETAGDSPESLGVKAVSSLFFDTKILKLLSGPSLSAIADNSLATYFMTSALRQLERLVRDGQFGSTERRLRHQIIVDYVLNTSRYLNDPNFNSFHSSDIQLLYELYDENFLEGLLLRSLDPKQISFRLSRRMTKAGGKTTRWSDRRRQTPPRYEIAISATLLFQSFQDPDRSTTVTGLDCESRLEGLMRIMEHEIVHLSEMLVWSDSNCALHRFQDIASRLFGHTDHRHDLMTGQEVARTQYGIRPGVRVRFDFEGRELEGIVNRITKRATVLVEDASGRRYSDGKHYEKYYIPLKDLEPVDARQT